MDWLPTTFESCVRWALFQLLSWFLVEVKCHSFSKVDSVSPSEVGGGKTAWLFEYIQDIACRDEVDKQILEELHFAGEYGMLPRDVAAKLGDKRFTRFYVTARLIQMNKKLDAMLGERVAEKRGKNWALTTFLRQAWGSEKEEIENDVHLNEV